MNFYDIWFAKESAKLYYLAYKGQLNIFNYLGSFFEKRSLYLYVFLFFCWAAYYQRNRAWTETQGKKYSIYLSNGGWFLYGGAETLFTIMLCYPMTIFITERVLVPILAILQWIHLPDLGLKYVVNWIISGAGRKPWTASWYSVIIFSVYRLFSMFVVNPLHNKYIKAQSYKEYVYKSFNLIGLIFIIIVLVFSGLGVQDGDSSYLIDLSKIYTH